MAGFTKTSKQGGDSNRKILLVGKLSSVFLDNNAAKELRCHNCKDEKEALKAAKRNSFDIVAVTISSLRREFWQEKIKCMFGVSAVHDKKLIFLLEALAPAA